MGKNNKIHTKKIHIKMMFYNDVELTNNESLAAYKQFVESLFGSVRPHTTYKFIVCSKGKNKGNIISCSITKIIIYHYNQSN